MTTVFPSSLKSGEAEWSSAVFGELLGALQIWKTLVHGDREFLSQSQDYSKDFLTLKFVLKALRNIANPHLNELDHNLCCLELSSFQILPPPKKTPNEPLEKNKDINYLTGSNRRHFRVQVWVFFFLSPILDLHK